MKTHDEVIENIVKILSVDDNIDKVLFFGAYLVNGKPYEISLIIFEKESNDYLASQFHYEKLLKEIGKDISLNILPVNSTKAQQSLNRRLKDALCIYQRKT